MGRNIDIREIIVRFVIGGAAVVTCYLVSVFSPVKFIGGIFAAFPAVMAAAVTMAGLRDGTPEAANVAKGAVAGMVGCTACVLAALYSMGRLNSWPQGLAIGVIIWLAVSLASAAVLTKKPKQEGQQEQES